jgi:hypothetical protein
MSRFPPSPVSGLTPIKQHWRLVVLSAVSCALLGLLIAFVISPTTYRATGGLKVDLNLGGIPTNSSYDANGDAVRIVQSNIENATLVNLHGAARRDPTAVSRIRCVPDTSDRFLTCSTTSQDRAAARAIIAQLFATFIPINIQSQIGEFHGFIRDLQEQYRNDKTTEAALVRRIQRNRHPSSVTRIPESKPSYQIGSLRVMRQIQKGILAHIAAAHRQIAAVSGTLHVAGRTDSTQVFSLTVFAVLGGIGLVFGLLVGAILTMRGGLRRTDPVANSRVKAKAPGGKKSKIVPRA